MSILKLRNFLGQTAPRYCHYDASTVIGHCKAVHAMPFLNTICEEYWTVSWAHEGTWEGNWPSRTVPKTMFPLSSWGAGPGPAKLPTDISSHINTRNTHMGSNRSHVLSRNDRCECWYQTMDMIPWMITSNEVSLIAYQWLWGTPHFGSLGSVLLHRHHHSQKGKEKQCQVSYVLA